MVVVWAMTLTMVWYVSSGRPRQLMCDSGEEQVFDLVPFTGTRGVVAHGDAQSGGGGQSGEFEIPQQGRCPLEPPPSAMIRIRPGGLFWDRSRIEQTGTP